MTATPPLVAPRSIVSAVVDMAIHLVATNVLRSSSSRTSGPSSSVQALVVRRDRLRVEKKKQTSRRNLGVRCVFLQQPTAAISFYRCCACAGATLSIIGQLLCQGHQPRQPPLTGRRARIYGLASPGARETGRAGTALLSWGTGTGCASVPARTPPPEAAAARCHSPCEPVWGRKKGRCTQENPYKFTD